MSVFSYGNVFFISKISLEIGIQNLIKEYLKHSISRESHQQF